MLASCLGNHYITIIQNVENEYQLVSAVNIRLHLGITLNCSVLEDKGKPFCRDTSPEHTWTRGRTFMLLICQCPIMMSMVSLSTSVKEVGTFLVRWAAQLKHRQLCAGVFELSQSPSHKNMGSSNINSFTSWLADHFVRLMILNLYVALNGPLPLTMSLSWMVWWKSMKSCWEKCTMWFPVALLYGKIC